MNEMELADWLHSWRECLRCEAPCQAYPCICSQRTDAIIAALRCGPEQDDKEIGEFQQRVYELCEKFYPYVDGAGSDTGDWRDFTLAERPPSGEMVMVPREPTEDMIRAGVRAWQKMHPRSPMDDFRNVYINIYRAMLSAAEASKEAK